MKMTELYGHIYDFTENYDSNDVLNVLAIHEYLKKKCDIK